MKFAAIIMALGLSITALAENPQVSDVHSNMNPAGWGNTPVVQYPATTAVFYGSGIDTSREWNICTGSTDGGVEVKMVQVIRPIQNCPGDYAVVRTYTLPDGTVIKRQIKRLSDGPVPI